MGKNAHGGGYDIPKTLDEHLEDAGFRMGKSCSGTQTIDV